LPVKRWVGNKGANNYRAVVTFGGGNGSSYDQAIIMHAPDTVSGFPSEFAYIKGHFSDYPYVIKEQRENRNNKTYDVVTLAAYDWRRRLVYFDISEFFKKK
jgi:hypothetical protein